MSDERAPRDDEGSLPLIRGRRNKVILVLAGMALLAVGILAAPRTQEPNPTSVVPPEPAAPLFQDAAQREVFRGMRLLQDAGRASLRHTLTLVAPGLERAVPRSRRETAPPGPRGESRPAVLLRPGTVLANLSGLSEAATAALVVEAGGIRTRVRRCDPATGLALLGLEGRVEAVPAPARLAEIGVGDAGVGVMGTTDAPVLTPVLVSGVRPGGVRLAFADLPPGAPVFDANGRLALVIAGENEAWTVGGAMSRLEALPRPVPAVLGLAFQPIGQELAPMVEGPGVLVTEVDAAEAADAAGVRPGDVVASVDARPIVTPDDMEVALSSLMPGRETPLLLRRGDALREVVAIPRAACVPETPSPPPSSGPAASTLFSAEQLARMGVPPEAQVLSIDGKAPARAAVRGRAPRLVRVRAPGEPAAFVVARP